MECFIQAQGQHEKKTRDSRSQYSSVIHDYDYDYYPGAGTVNSDTLCMDASDTKIVVAGYNSQKVSSRVISEL